MAQTAIGTGALILTANADKLLSGLDKADKATTAWAKKQKQKGAGEGGLGAGLGGLIGGFAGGLIGSTIGGTIHNVFDKLTTKLADAVTGATAFKKELDAAAKAAAEVSRNLDRSLKVRDEILSAAANPEQKLEVVGVEIARTTKNLKTYQEQIADTKAEIDNLNSLKIDNAALFAERKYEDTLADAQSRLAGLETSAVKLNERLKDLNTTQNRLKNPASDPALVGEILRQNDALEDQINTMGMLASEAALYKLAQKGATVEMLAQLRAGYALLDALKDTGPRLGGAFTEGSAAAYSIITKAQVQGMTAEGRKAEIDLLRKAVEELKKSNRLLEKIPVPGVI